MLNSNDTDISDLLPDRETDAHFDKISIANTVIEAEDVRAQRRANAIELARIKAREMRATQNNEIYDGFEYKEEFNKHVAEERHERNKNVIQDLKVVTPTVIVGRGDAALAGTTRLEVAKLLNSLNINLNVQLTKTDTHNLLATLLTCNEAQLEALKNNKKIPLAIKTVIKRLIIDGNDGNIATIERLWNRVFGPTMMQVDMPQGYQGIVPNVPVSREAYILIRETLIGKG
jgi:hypothetical protein